MRFETRGLVPSTVSKMKKSHKDKDKTFAALLIDLTKVFDCLLYDFIIA